MVFKGLDKNKDILGPQNMLRRVSEETKLIVVIEMFHIWVKASGVNYRQAKSSMSTS